MHFFKPKCLPTWDNKTPKSHREHKYSSSGKPLNVPTSIVVVAYSDKYILWASPCVAGGAAESPGFVPGSDGSDGPRCGPPRGQPALPRQDQAPPGLALPGSRRTPDVKPSTGCLCSSLHLVSCGHEMYIFIYICIILTIFCVFLTTSFVLFFNEKNNNHENNDVLRCRGN